MRYEDEAEKRRRKNRDLVERMKRGDSLSSIPQEATWFPPRPRVEKDLSKLYPELAAKKPEGRFTIVKEEDDGEKN